MRNISLAVLVAGAAAAVAFVLRAGQRANSHLLIVLFVGWVLSPYVALLPAYALSKRWPEKARISFYWVAVGLTLSTVGVYALDFAHPAAKEAPVFLMTPLGSWVLIATALFASVRMAKRTMRD